jgi:hypothetical protein
MWMSRSVRLVRFRLGPWVRRKTRSPILPVKVEPFDVDRADTCRRVAVRRSHERSSTAHLVLAPTRTRSSVKRRSLRKEISVQHVTRHVRTRSVFCPASGFFQWFLHTPPPPPPARGRRRGPEAVLVHSACGVARLLTERSLRADSPMPAGTAAGRRGRPCPTRTRASLSGSGRTGVDFTQPASSSGQAAVAFRRTSILRTFGATYLITHRIIRI